MNFIRVVIIFILSVTIVTAERGPWYLIGRHASTSPATGLLTGSQLIYDGAFRIPFGTDASFGFASSPIAYDPNGNGGAGSLFIGTYNFSANWGGVSEITIPTPLISGTLSALPRSSTLQPDTDATETNLFNCRTSDLSSSSQILGLLVRGSTLYMNCAAYYDGDGSQPASFFVRNKNLSLTGGAGGLALRHTTLAKQGWTAGYMADVPAERQSALGGDTIAGLWSVPITTRESTGPSAFAFNAASIGPTPITPIVNLFYPPDHPLGKTYGVIVDGEHVPIFNPTSPVGEGAVIVPGSRSIFFFGGMGIGPWCYGTGTPNMSLDHTDAGDGSIYCYDPEENAKGGHAYPSKNYYWLYDLDNLIAVKNGTIQSYTPQPYEYGDLTAFAPTINGLYMGKPSVVGVAYDAVNRRIYLTMQKQDGPAVVIHRFHID